MNRLVLIFGLATAVDRRREQYPYEVDFGRNLGVVTGFTAEGYEDVVHLYGVPYAHPPTGDRRFRVPELMEYWPEGQEFLKNKPMCPQIMFDGSTLDIADEDCLYINIWAPVDAVEGRLSRLDANNLVNLTTFLTCPVFFIQNEDYQYRFTSMGAHICWDRINGETCKVLKLLKSIILLSFQLHIVLEFLVTCTIRLGL